MPDASTRLEIVHTAGADPAPTTEDQLVLYCGSPAAVQALASCWRPAGHAAEPSPNPFWQRDGAVCFTDPDG